MTQLEFGQVPFETMLIEPTAEMPLEVFRHCHWLASAIEHMDRLPDGRVLWDPEREMLYAVELADAEYEGIRCGWFSVTMELPKELVDSWESPDE